jgi:tRNA1Val (adenine37-N6)-methyltransferase
MPFRFRQFTIEDTESTMRVGTDAVLLGSWCDFNEAHSILDIGTGCGILALMAAQKNKNAFITAIDIDYPSYQQASYNFTHSPWYARMHCIHSDLVGFTKARQLSDHFTHFDHIISNPPYFSKSLKSSSVKRNIARHDDTLPINDLIHQTYSLLKEGGRFSIVYPYSESTSVIKLCAENSLILSRQLNIIPSEKKASNRVLMEFIKNTQSASYNCLPQTISIRNSEGRYTTEYKALTAEFYLFLAD